MSGADANWTFSEPGLYGLRIEVTDPLGDPGNTTYNITVFGIRPPSPDRPVTFLDTPEDSLVAITQTPGNGSNGTLNWRWTAPAWSLSSEGSSINWTFEAPGVYNLSLTVTNPRNESALGYVVVNVSDETAPNATIVGPSVVDVFVLALFSANVTDNDARYNESDWTLTWTYRNATHIISSSGLQAGFTDTVAETVTIELDVVDASGNSIHLSQPLLVNAPPRIDNAPPAEAYPSQLWQWAVNATDPEGAFVTLSLGAAPGGMALVGNQVTWTPGAGDLGIHVIPIVLSDGRTTAYRNFTLYVVDPTLVPGNHPPMFESEPPTEARVSRDYLYDIRVNDTDGDAVAITVSGLDGYAIDATNRLRWTPPWQPGPDERFERLLPVTITAFDGKQASTQEFVVRFRNPPNIWPVLDGTFSIGDALVGQVIRVRLFENWSDGDDVLGNLTIISNDTDPSVRRAVGGILRWHIDRSDPLDPVLVIEVIGEGRVNFTMVARDPSGGKSDNAYVSVNAVRGSGGALVAGLPWWLLLLLAGGGAAGAVGLAVALRRSRAAANVARSALEAAGKPPGGRVIIQQAPPSAGAPPKDTYVIEGVFIIYRDGRRFYSKTDISEVKLEDPELVSSMFAAVQAFIKDSFRAQGELNRLGFGENTILIERGRSIFMAAIIFGEPTPELGEHMVQTIRTIENAYAGIIEEWDGSTDALEGIERFVEPFLASTAYLSRADVTQALTQKTVKLLSELEFFQGFVRLKVGVKNDTESVITKVTLAVDYNDDVLRLHHTEPNTYKVAGSEVQLGVLNPGEKISVAYYFDPQICAESQIDGIARYRDAKGHLNSVPMKTRKAEVVCPIFFTKEHANTAMLRRLIESELDQRDSKVYNVVELPQGVKWEELFGLAKEVVLAHDVQIVRDFIVEGPYHGEAWFFGETKVKGYKVVIRASVLENHGKMEFFAASTQIRAITGLLADFNHTLHYLIVRKYATLKIEAEFGDEVKAEIQKTSLLSKMQESELERDESARRGA